MLALSLGMVATQAAAWGNHSLATYRALEKMPEVAQASTVNAETLDSFLKSEEKTLEALLASHEAWAIANLDRYAANPDALAFIADATRTDESRRIAFLTALRMSASTKFALHAVGDGDSATALSVIATATDEPASGMDAHTVRTLAPLRVYQFSTLASLAFRTDHPYWGWRFAGIALHYVQDLTQPYHANLQSNDTSLRFMALDTLAKVGWDGPKSNFMRLQANQSRVLDKYQAELMQAAATSRQDGALDKALRNADKDRSYPDWGTKYLRDTVVPQAQAQFAQTTKNLLDTMPAQYVLDPTVDFAAHESGVFLTLELRPAAAEKRARLDATLVDLMANFGAHSRNMLRAVLRASTQF
jgi:ABC-type multidrug transport system fused ATPase/permease subunit